MGSLLRTVWHRLFGPPPKLVCELRVWSDGVDELRSRTGGYRESGAFLLGTIKDGIRIVRRFLYYDDIDPNCFANGIVEFDGAKFGLVWQICRDSQLTVVADVHVHPGGYGQSGTDRHNPEKGHLALILPDFAAGTRLPGAIGIYEYLGSRQWLNHSLEGIRVFRLRKWSVGATR
jgi:proteasome lid subunit RPN8/RPN11